MARASHLKDPWPRQRPGVLAPFRDHVRILRETGHFVAERLVTSLLVWLLVGIALALPAGLFLLQVNLSAMTAAWDGRPGLSVYFELDAAAEDVSTLATELRGQAAVAEVTEITAAQALAEFQAQTGLDDALRQLDSNPLPASLRATLRPSADGSDLQALADIAGGSRGVADVDVEKTWLERVTDISQVVTRMGLMLAVLFGLGAVLITATSVRLAIEARLEEVRVLKLVGASDAQMRRPFLYFGIVYGLGGGLLAAMLISLSLLVVEGPLVDLAGSYGGELDLVGFNLPFLAVLFCAAGALGITGALIAVRQRLSGLDIL